jgi:hypothetical protein
VIEWLPWARVEVVYIALPEVSGIVARTVAPSINCTEPVAAAGVSVAVKVTAWVGFEGFKLDATAAELAGFTTSATAEEYTLA